MVQNTDDENNRSKENSTFNSATPSFPLDNHTQSSPPILGGVPAGRGGKILPLESKTLPQDTPVNTKLNNLPYLKTFRRTLRNNSTPAEAKLWTLLQNSQVDGRKFRRQHSVGNYILDFYCPAEQLAIELDGEIHNTPQAQLHDGERTLFLNSVGIHVIRFENKLVFEYPEYMITEIKNNFKSNRPPYVI